jgi:hypothetical protein
MHVYPGFFFGSQIGEGSGGVVNYMRRARCPDCGNMGVRYDRSSNLYTCSCGSSFEHHPDLCPFYHRKYGCIYSPTGRKKAPGLEGAFPDPFRDPYPSPFPEKRKRR